MKHLNQNLDVCYESLLQELCKMRVRCPRLYLLNDEDLIDVVSCGSNLDSLALKIGKVFGHLKSLRVNLARLEVIGCYDRNNEYFSLVTVNKTSIDSKIFSL